LLNIRYPVPDPVKNRPYINQSINQYPFIVWYGTSNIPADNNAFGIYITGFTQYTKRMLVILQIIGLF